MLIQPPGNPGGFLLRYNVDNPVYRYSCCLLAFFYVLCILEYEFKLSGPEEALSGNEINLHFITPTQ